MVTDRSAACEAGQGEARGAAQTRLASPRPAGGKAIPLALVLALALVPSLPSTQAQFPVPTPLDPVVGEARDDLSGVKQQYVGPDLEREDIDVDLRLEFTDLDFDTLSLVFGGGRFMAKARVSATIDMRAISADRVQEAIDGAMPGVGNLTAVGLEQAEVIPADAFRATFTGEALKAFQDEQEARLAEFIETTIPNVTVLSTSFEWVNISPEESLEEGASLPRAAADPTGAELYDLNDPTEPPITLRATVDFEYLQRTSLLDILETAMKPKTEEEKARKKEVADAGAEYDRSAFGLLGIRQVLDLQAERGWNVRVAVIVPEGYTIEEASPDVLVGGDLREAQVLTLGKDADGKVLNPVSLTLSNRFLVSMALLAAVLLVGGIIRFPVILAVNAWRRRMRR